jgi:MerR family transcriptional regulator, thiopeptide resistance regulator
MGERGRVGKGQTMTRAEADVGYPVGEVAELTGVTVRALHHYDEIGLLRPSERSKAGYRLYDPSDLERLQQILFYRELGFSLADIGSILSDPKMNAAAHLRRQHHLLKERTKRLQAMVEAVEHIMEVEKMGISLTPEERFEVFGDWSPEDYAEEAEERWGDSDAYVQSQRRTAAYTKDDWLRIKAEGANLDERFAAALRDGASSDSAEAMELAEEHRQQITKHFYDCSFQIHKGLGEMYVADPRFRDRYEEIAPGLAQYVRAAILANADRGEAES